MKRYLIILISMLPFVCLCQNMQSGFSNLGAKNLYHINELNKHPKSKITPFEGKLKITLFPNPANTSLSIKFNTIDDEIINTIIYDLSGKLVSQEKINKTGNSINLDISQLPNNLYIVWVHTNSAVTYAKFNKF